MKLYKGYVFLRPINQVFGISICHVGVLSDDSYLECNVFITSLV